jgi:hypothetical protein
MIRRNAYSYRRTPKTIRVSASPSHRAYVRRVSGKTIRVKSSLIMNRGLPGKGPYTLPPLTPGKLYGYTVSAPQQSRHNSLRMAMKYDSPMAVFRRLQLLSHYLKRTSPTAVRTILKNASWVRKF